MSDIIVLVFPINNGRGLIRLIGETFFVEDTEDLVHAAQALREDILLNILGAREVLEPPSAFQVEPGLIKRLVNQEVIGFVRRVNNLAEQKIEQTHRLEGSHYAAMTELVKEYEDKDDDPAAA